MLESSIPPKHGRLQGWTTADVADTLPSRLKGINDWDIDVEVVDLLESVSSTGPSEPRVLKGSTST